MSNPRSQPDRDHSSRGEPERVDRGDPDERGRSPWLGPLLLTASPFAFFLLLLLLDSLIR